MTTNHCPRCDAVLCIDYSYDGPDPTCWWCPVRNRAFSVLDVVWRNDGPGNGLCPSLT